MIQAKRYYLGEGEGQLLTPFACESFYETETS